LLRKDSREAGLDQPKEWSNFVKWDEVEKMSKEYRPRELLIREFISQIIGLRGEIDQIEPLRQSLSDTLKDLEESIRSTNTLLIREMAERLKIMTKDAD